jgi:hypothetical protein
MHRGIVKQPWTNGRKMQRTVAVVVGLLALSGIAAAAAHYLGTPYNKGFLDHPTVTVLHVVLGGLYLTFAPFQFVPAPGTFERAESPNIELG